MLRTGQVEVRRKAFQMEETAETREERQGNTELYFREDRQEID